MPSKDSDLSLLPPTLTSATTVKFNAGQFVSRRQEKVSKHYQIKSALGSGGYGEVFLAEHRDSKSERAIKVIDKSKWNEQENDAVINEFNIIKDLDHPNLLKMYEMFEDHRHFYIITDIYKGGELFDEIEKNGAFPEEEVAILMQSVLSCVNYFHQKGIVHRDLKPENILLTKSKKLDDLKIIDFGLACYCQKDERMHAAVGSSYYKAPELLHEDYGKKCDIWSCGVICFILLAGYAPFDGDTDALIEDAIREGEYEFDDPIWDMISEEAKDFIEELLTYNETHRPTAAEALTHPWLENTRKAERGKYVKSESDTMHDTLNNLANFQATSKLKQATLAFIASQLLMKEEREAIDEVFRALDVNCDGKLTPDEIKLGYKEFFDKDLSDQEVDAIFQRVNFRGTGAIDYSEFVVASMFEKNLLDDKRLLAAFKMFDSDQSGFIDSGNIKKVLSSCGTIQADMDDYINNKIIAEFDKDGDGRISFDDFKFMMFCTVKEPLQTKGRRRSFLNGVTQLSHETLPEVEHTPKPSANPVFPDQKNRKKRGSIKDVRDAFKYMAVFESAKDLESPNPLFKSSIRFASVRGSPHGKKKVMPPRTTTRESVSLEEFDGTTRLPSNADLSGDLKFMKGTVKVTPGRKSSLIEESDEEED